MTLISADGQMAGIAIRRLLPAALLASLLTVEVHSEIITDTLPDGTVCTLDVTADEGACLTGALFADGFSGTFSIPATVMAGGVETAVTSVASNAFSDRMAPTAEGLKITELIFPAGIRTIGDYAFYKCSGIRNITWPSELTSIGTYAFFDTAVAEIELPASVMSIGRYAFAASPSPDYDECLHSFRVAPDAGLQVIAINTFLNRTKLATIELNSAVTKIEGRAFSGCRSISSLTLRSQQPPEVGYIGTTNKFSPFVIDNKNASFGDDVCLTVPESSIADYRASEWHTIFSNIQGAVFDNEGEPVTPPAGASVIMTITSAEGGSVSLPWPKGKEQWLTVAAPDGLEIKTVELNGETIYRSAPELYTLPALDGDAEIRIEYRMPVISLSKAVEAAGCSIESTPSGFIYRGAPGDGVVLAHSDGTVISLQTADSEGVAAIACESSGIFIIAAGKAVYKVAR